MSPTPDPDRIDAYLHGLLNANEAAEVERFIAQSPEWRDAETAGRKRIAVLRSLPGAEASEGLIRRTVQAIDQVGVRRKRRFRAYLGALSALTAASILLLAGLHFKYANLAPTPFDLQAFGQSQLLAGSNASLRIGLNRADSRLPVPNVPIQMILVNRITREEIRLADFQSDERGTAAPRFSLPDWPSGKYTLRLIAQTQGGPEVLERSITLKRESKLMLSSDKPMYQPGQTIHLRALALRRPDLKPIEQQAALFTITDPQGNVIFKKSDVTSRFGISSADCPLAVEIQEGAYRVACRVGDTESELTLQIEKYVLPKFKVALSLDKPYYQPGQLVSGAVQCDYFFGKPVAKGEARLIAQTTDVGVSTLHEETVTLDQSGHATFSFKLPDHFVGREQTQGDARFQVVSEVTDTAGQKHAVADSRLVTAQPLRVEAIAESGMLVKGVPNTVYLLATYADGRPAPSTVTINSEPAIETNALGVASFELTPNEAKVGLTITARDAAGLTGRRHVALETGSQANDFLFRTDKAAYRGGDTIHITTIGGGQQPMFLDVLKDGQTLLTQSIPVEQGRGETALDLPADCFGTLQLYAYRFSSAGIAVMKTRTIYVDSPQPLKIAVSRDADVYRPGQQAKLTFALTDQSGKPTPGALSLAAVDEAVFHVLKQRPGLEGAFFNLEDELLKPVYAIYPWSPFAADGPIDEEQFAQRRELERAIFSRTSRSVAPVSLRTAHGVNLNEVATNDAGGERGDAELGMPEIGPPEAMLEVALRSDDASPDEYVPSRPAPSPMSLAMNTYPEKAQRVQSERAAGLRRVARMKNWAIGMFALAVIGGFAAFKTRAFLITAGTVSVLAIVAAGGLFALTKASPRMAREIFRAVPLANELAVATGVAVDANWQMSPKAEAGAFDGGIAMMMGDPEAMAASDVTVPVRVRRQFPETLLWRPQLITDDNGHATLELPMADSITNWRLSASAVSASGQLGALQDGIRVFQPFFVDLNLPVALVRNDEVAMPIVVYNYLQEPQSVELTLERDEWFEILGVSMKKANAGDPSETDGVALAEIPGEPPAPTKSGMQNTFVVSLQPNEIQSLSVRIRAKNVGLHSLQATARSRSVPAVADALRREILVESDGVKVEQVLNGSLGEPMTAELSLPEETISGSVRAIVKLYPSTFSQLLEGLDAIFHMPYGCFEQTSSTTYPNILALDYLKRTKKASPEIEAKARQYIHLGYQRLIGFEVTEGGVRGGFDWFGNPPANQTLTAYGLHEFTDMAKVHDVDPAMIARTRNWLLSRRQPDGSWKADVGMLNDGLASSIQRGKDLTLATTAYVGWAVFREGNARFQAETTLNYLLAHEPTAIESPYVLALLINAVAAIDPQNPALPPYVERLESLKSSDARKKTSWWEMPQESQTCFHSTGLSGNVEVTALATLALLETKRHPVTARQALAWLVEQKDPQGTWHSTQATVLALKALIEGTSSGPGEETERVIEVRVDGELVQTVAIPPDQADVMQQLDLSKHFSDGRHTLELKERTETGTGYQVTFRHFVPGSSVVEPKSEPLTIAVDYDKTTLAVNDFVTATANVANVMSVEAPMVILDLPVPAGFRMASEPWQELAAAGTIAKFQQNPRSVTVYLRTLKPGEVLKLVYRLEATMPVKLTVPAAVVYEYYNPEKRGKGRAVEMVVNPNVF